MLILLFIIATVPKYYKLAKCYCYDYCCCYAFGKSIKIIIRLWQLYADTYILIFSSNGQQQFVSSLVLHLSISSSFAERGGKEKGNYRFLWLMQQQFKLHLRNYNDSRELEGERERVE